MTKKNKEDLVLEDNSTLRRLELGPNESGSCDYPNIQRFSLTSRKKKSPEPEKE
ncbi:hypothetical protein [Clostridium magnum]|uniref:Uncharacterized protein n=1 Tax=Clostridium magnum DSM 2767 TaxID=1121326 RepID=A0A161XB18_9CLOT|nr:hypothetical protein [Clostridium magnum]KZL91456.1 hypothetical protein CLMAG_32150 [Clostridium magnum DSM 2767]SHH42999.1 hypothetical protein SAMN02745944_00655 [Clostridium magnum DSM 2767]